MIIDSHCHLGKDVVYDFEVTEDTILNNCMEHNISGAIIQPCITRPYIVDTREAHDRIFRFCGLHPGRFWGMASVNPHFTREDYEQEVCRCIYELGFVGVKLTPNGHAVDLSSRDACIVFDTARKLKIPVMVHTGMGIPFADPTRLFPILMEYPDVVTVIAHAGSDFFASSAMFLAKKFDHVYLEPSGIGVEGIEMFLKNLPPSKIMFSTDVPIQTAGEVLKYTVASSDKAVLDQIFYLTAAKVFKLDLHQIGKIEI